MHDALKTATVSKQFKILSHKEKDYHEEMLAMQNSATVTSTWIKWINARTKAEHNQTVIDRETRKP